MDGDAELLKKVLIAIPYPPAKMKGCINDLYSHSLQLI
jgi:hypothetical protein